MWKSYQILRIDNDETVKQEYIFYSIAYEIATAED